MSASLKTTNLELPVYAPNDTTSYLTDWNGAMNIIDQQVQSGKESDMDLNEKLTDMFNFRQSGSKETISGVSGRLTVITNDINIASTTIVLSVNGNAYQNTNNHYFNSSNSQKTMMLLSKLSGNPFSLENVNFNEKTYTGNEYYICSCLLLEPGYSSIDASTDIMAVYNQEEQATYIFQPLTTSAIPTGTLILWGNRTFLKTGNTFPAIDI